MRAVSTIHGASKKNLKPAYDGMFDTLQKRCKMKDLTNYVLGNETLTKSVVSKHYKKELIDFETSKENAERSIATFYFYLMTGSQLPSNCKNSLRLLHFLFWIISNTVLE